MNTANPTVSVLMTTYNRESYVTEAIKSVLASDYNDFELIISDDGSSDRTLEICRQFVDADSRVRLYVNEKNIGDYPNRNKAATYAKGRFLKYVDSDDMIYPWALGFMVSMMDRFPGAGWGLCSMEPNNERIFPFSLSPSEAYRYHYFGPGLFRRSPLSSIIRKDVFDEVSGFRAMRMVGDYDMWQRLAMRFDVVLMPQGMVWYRSHGDQEFKNFLNYLPDYEKVKLEHLYSGNCPLQKTEREKIVRSERRKLLKHMAACLATGKLKELGIVSGMYFQYFKVKK